MRQLALRFWWCWRARTLRMPDQLVYRVVEQVTDERWSFVIDEVEPMRPGEDFIRVHGHEV